MKIAIISPSGAAVGSNIDAAARVLTDWGFEVAIGHHAYHREGRFAGTPEARWCDMEWALTDQTIDAILCSRGGYGAVHLLSDRLISLVKTAAKPIVGYSDITLLHAAWQRAGVPSIHAPMTSHLADCGGDDPYSLALRDRLLGEPLTALAAPAHLLNREGPLRGTLYGGNLAVLQGLRGTPYDIDFTDKILFIEDIGENMYKIERILYNLQLGRKLEGLAGLLVGSFTQSDASQEEIYRMIYPFVAPYDYPLYFNFPVGHTPHNLALPVGETIDVAVSIR